jgi:hypothetical protein
MLSGCGQRGDLHNPLGLTGGSDGGYGKRQSYYYDSSIPQNDNSVVGVWTETDKTLTINSDGTFELKSVEEIRTGTYDKVKDNLTLNFKDGFSITYTYRLVKDRLNLEEVE